MSDGQDNGVELVRNRFMPRAAGMSSLKTFIRMVSFLRMASPACKSRTVDSLSSNILCKQSREVVPESRSQTTRVPKSQNFR